MADRGWRAYLVLSNLLTLLAIAKARKYYVEYHDCVKIFPEFCKIFSL